jgi:Peptidase inhibitor family I36
MKLRLKAALFVTATLALAPIAAAPAQATTCASANFCVYMDYDGGYNMWSSTTNVSSYFGLTYPQGSKPNLNDSGSFFTNRSAYGNRVSFYVNEGYSNFMLCVNPSSQGAAPLGHNDQASSHKYQAGVLSGCA